MERAITLTIRHRLRRVELLELRDDIIEKLAELGLALEMTHDGTEVIMRHPTVPHFMDALADTVRCDVAAAERLLNHKYGDPSDPDWKGDGCRG